MGFDTECDLAVEADGREEVAAGIRAFRNRLLGEHLGVPADEVDQRIRATGSLVSAIEQLRGPGRTLRPDVEPAPHWLVEALPSREVIDPERPLDFKRWVSEGVPPRLRAEAEINLRLIGVLALVAAAAVVAWTGTSLPERWTSLLPAFSTTMALGVLVAYLLATLLPLPTTWLTVWVVLAFDLLPGVGLAMLGLMTNALTGYVIGQRLSRDTVRRLAGRRLNRISRRLARRGLLAVVALRMLPVTAFSTVGLVAGASRVRLSDYALGTLLGILPVTTVVGLLVNRLEAAVRQPDSLTVSVAAGLFAVTGTGALALARRLNATLRRRPRHD